MTRSPLDALLLLAAASALGACGQEEPKPLSVLLFSKTAEYRHGSIATGVEALRDLGSQAGWTVDATEDAARFSTESLSAFDVVVFLSTTGDVLDDTQQDAMTAFIQSGKGFVGIHSASDTEYEWPWYGALVGAYFKGHPAIQPAELDVVDHTHPSTTHLPPVWQRTDEWYGFQGSPQNVHVLLQLDESSYEPGESAMGGNHPIAWYHQYDGGRAFYTALGHTAESYREPAFLTHIEQAIAWAGGNLAR